MTLLKRATIKSYDAGSHRAAAGISGSLSVWLDSIAVSDAIAASSVVVGRECAVLFHTDDNPDDAVVIAVTGGGPPVAGASPLTTKGDLFTYDTGDQRLAVGANNAVLQADSAQATGLIWRGTPKLAGIADTGGTTRLTLAASSPNVTVTGTLGVTSVLRTDNGVPNANVSGWFGGSAWPYGKVGVIAALGTPPGPTANWAVGIQGQVLFSGTGTDPVVTDGLVFTVGTLSVTGTHTFAEVNCMYVGSLWFGATGLTVTLLRGIHIVNFASALDQIAACTTMYGIQINGTSSNKIGTAYGVWIGDNSGVTAAGYGLYIEDAATYAIWVDAGLSRFDGDGTHVFELPANATDPTGGGGAAAGRIPVTVGGATKYIAYY